MNLKLASLFQDQMVLQRERPLPVWGWSRPGAAITVTLNQATATTVVTPAGKWLLQLPPQAAGGPFELTVSDGDDTITLQDVWLGEVWLASGQSNMEMKVAESYNFPAEQADSDQPAIRVFTTDRVIALAPASSVGGSWQVCNPETVGRFTAAGYFFARELQRALGVAIGIIDSSWGGTVVEAWTSLAGLETEPAHIQHSRWLNSFMTPDGNLDLVACETVKRDWEDSLPKDRGNRGETEGWHLANCSDTAWRKMELPCLWENAGHNTNGVFWFRRRVEIPAAWEGRELELSVGACDKADHTYFNGRLVGAIGLNDHPTSWSALRRYRIAADSFKAGDNSVAVRVFSHLYAGGMAGPSEEMWLAPVAAPAAERLPLAGEWRYMIEQDYGRVTAKPPPGPDNPNTATVLYNGMVAPHVPYALKGFIWYQGESNADRYAEYRTLFPALIRDWRRLFGRDDLAFYWVQLANFRQLQTGPTESTWAQLREAQRLTLELPHTGMAVAIDIGDAEDIHPKNKQDVGKRLALAALAHSYGLPEFAPGSSPLPASAHAVDNQVCLRFKAVGGDLATSDDAPPCGFELAGHERRFYQATATITGSDTVTLSCREVATPRWVRYAWADNPVCNLVGGRRRLPASSFELPLPYGNWL